jgi:riboflavin kinase / FMN adenylyltransferase
VELIRGQLRLTRQLSRSVVTLGNFDGFHRGHQQLIAQLREQAQRLQAPTVVITFEPQPQEFFNPSRRQPRLMRFHEKWRFLLDQNVDYLVCLRFNAVLAACSATDFVEDILIRQLGMQAIIVGQDFRFGAKRTGDLALLQTLGKRHGFEVIPAPPFLLDGQRVSSTWVRQALQANDFALTDRLLGRPYFLCGKVVHGDARGRQWGFPTANIHLTDKPVSVAGIYVVRVIGLEEQPLPAVASVGVRPMFSNDRVFLEVHLLDFNRDIYGCLLRVEFLHKLRDEQVFPSTEKLIEQIHTDVAQTRQFFEKENDRVNTKF